MTQVVVPVRYPLNSNSRATIGKAIDVAEDAEASLTVLHVNLYQNNRQVSRRELKGTVEEVFGTLPRTRYVVRSGLLVEERFSTKLPPRRQTSWSSARITSAAGDR